MKYLVLIYLSLLVSCASKKSVNDMPKEASLHFGSGTQSLMNKKYTDALASLLEANRLYPNSSEILNNLAMAYYFKEQKDMALKTLKRAIELNPDNSDAKNNLASIYLEEKNVDGAEKLYHEVLGNLTYDKQARTYYNLGLIQLENRHDTAKAEEYFKRSLKEDDGFCPSWHYLGVINYKRKKFNQALKEFRESTMGTCQGNPVSFYFHALTLIELKRFDEARMKLDEIENRFPKSDYSEKARAKIAQLNHLENYKINEFQASRKSLESPEF